MPGAEYKPGDTRGERQDKVRDSAGYLSDNFHRAPLMLIPCLWGRLDNASVVQGAGAWGSLLPAVWSFMLALRERAMGSAWTTIHLMNDGEQQVAEIARHPVRQGHPGRAVPDRLHHRHRLQAGQARAARQGPPLGPVVSVGYCRRRRRSSARTISTTPSSNAITITAAKTIAKTVDARRSPRRWRCARCRRSRRCAGPTA